MIAIKSGSWRDGGKSAKRREASLRDYAHPNLGMIPVSDIETADVLAALTPVWNSIPETARRVRQRIPAVVDWAMAQGHRVDNPAGDALRVVLPSNFGTRRRQRALHHSQVGGTVELIRTSSRVSPATKLCFELMVLTEARSGEARGATWDESDMSRRVSSIPADRMKRHKNIESR